ncbi:hypothetical protein ACJJTC_002409 [Scirpophaga incertulas]
MRPNRIYNLPCTVLADVKMTSGVMGTSPRIFVEVPQYIVVRTAENVGNVSEIPIKELSVKINYQRDQQPTADNRQSKKWPLIERLTFLENVPTERKTVCNIERANDIYDSENEVSNNNETCFNKEIVEPNEIELNSEETSRNVMNSAPSTSGTVMVNASCECNRVAARVVDAAIRKLLAAPHSSDNGPRQLAATARSRLS